MKMTESILKLSTWSYKQGNIDGINNLKDAFNTTSSLMGKKQFSIDDINQAIDALLKDLEKEHTKTPQV